jgi:GDPmannose 4,6-dehydratase
MWERSKPKKALILGIGGQDGSYLAEVLLAKGDYEVHGLYRRSSIPNLGRIAHLMSPQAKDGASITLHMGDITDTRSIWNVVEKVKPTIIFNEADQDNVDWSFACPHYSADVTFKAVLGLLEICKARPEIKLFQPLSATIFGGSAGVDGKQNENTPLDPMSPYAVAKAGAYHACRYYRRAHAVQVSTAILYNHDSIRRYGNYLLHKICRAAVGLRNGTEKEIVIGSLRQAIDIGHAAYYMEGVVKLMECRHPCDDYVMGTDTAWTIEKMVDHAVSLAYEGKSPTYTVREDPRFARPGPIATMCGDSSKAKRMWGWSPVGDVGLVIKILVDYYSDLAEQGRA